MAYCRLHCSLCARQRKCCHVLVVPCCTCCFAVSGGACLLPSETFTNNLLYRTTKLVCHQESLRDQQLTMALVADSKPSVCQTASRSASLDGCWSNLFSSFTDQNASWQKSDQHQASAIAEAELQNPAAAIHQSAAFAALFDDMISSQSCDAFTCACQPPLASAQSSAASLCDSATSFSFKTAQHARTEAALPLSMNAAKPYIFHPQSTIPALSLAVSADERTDMSATLKDWQISRDTKDAVVGHSLQHAAVQGLSEWPEEFHKATMPVVMTYGERDQPPASARRRLNMDSAAAVASCDESQPGTVSSATRARQASRQARKVSTDRKHVQHTGTANALCTVS